MPSSPDAEVPAEEPALVAVLRRGLLGVAALSVTGTVIELAMLRHWTQASQVIAWGACAALLVAIALAARPASPTVVRVARTIAFVVCVSAAFGVWEHVEGNYDAAPLDAEYGERWDSMSAAARWWAAFTKSVGPSPALAPLVLVQAALLILLALHRHPAAGPARGRAYRSAA